MSLYLRRIIKAKLTIIIPLRSIIKVLVIYKCNIPNNYNYLFKLDYL